MRELEREIEQRGVHEYRAAARKWLFGWCEEQTGYPLYMVTLTLKDKTVLGTVIDEHDPEYVLKVAHRACKSSGLAGPLFVEHGRRGGRVHAHGLMVALHEKALTELQSRWTGPDPAEPLYGFQKSVYVTDVLGAVHYVTKAFGPNSPVRWVNREQEWQSGIQT